MNSLVILPGWTRDRRSYKKLIGSAPSNWQVFVPSYRDLKPYKGIDFFNKRLIDYLEKHNLANINLLGHSLGGALAVSFAASHQNKIKRLFLVDSKGLHDSESLFYEIRNFVKEHLKKSLVENVSDFARVMRSPSLNFRLGLLAHFADAKTQADKIRVDTIIFWGEQDFMAPIADGKKLKNLIPNAKLVVLKRMGHDWILNSPKHFWNNLEQGLNCRIS